MVQRAHPPRVQLGFFPTPLHPMKRLGAYLGGIDLWIKRDDCTGLGLGGNKVRKLEYIMAAALAEGADVILTTGAVSSNHARQTAAAAAMLGLPCHLVLSGRLPEAPQGNFLLNGIFGAQMTCVKLADIESAILSVMDAYRAQGKKPYFIPAGGHTPEGAIAYAGAFREIRSELPQPGTIITAVGTGTTYVGLELGRRETDPSSQIIGISVGQDTEGCQREAFELLSEMLQGTKAAPAAPTELEIIDRYVGEGYTLVYPEVREVIETTARLEGILLDPVYTGKAMVGLFDLARSGRFSNGKPVVFLHTGGAPEVFSYRHIFQEGGGAAC
ncbi:MAG: D-cysteine desulfhydrase family protein [Solirubrobacterales bacterium]